MKLCMYHQIDRHVAGGASLEHLKHGDCTTSTLTAEFVAEVQELVTNPKQRKHAVSCHPSCRRSSATVTPPASPQSVTMNRHQRAVGGVCVLSATQLLSTSPATRLAALRFVSASEHGDRARLTRFAGFAVPGSDLCLRN